MAAPKNSFIDINNPPQEPYRRQDYPKCQYHPDGRIIKVADEDEELAMNEQGFGSVVFAEYDYNSVSNGRAKLKDPNPDDFRLDAPNVDYPQNEAAEIDAEEAEVTAKIAELSKNKGKRR